jgi:hypothetical protein
MVNYAVEKIIDKTAKRVDIKADCNMLTRNHKVRMMVHDPMSRL